MEIEKYKGQGESSDSQRKKILAQQEHALQHMKDNISEYREKHQKAQRELDSLKPSIYNIFMKIGASDIAPPEMIGSPNMVDESSIMKYLGMIEQRVNEILQVYATQKSSDKDHHQDAASLIGKGPSVPMGAVLGQVRPPKLEDFDKEERGAPEDGGGVPIDREHFYRALDREYKSKDI